MVTELYVVIMLFAIFIWLICLGYLLIKGGGLLAKGLDNLFHEVRRQGIKNDKRGS